MASKIMGLAAATMLGAVLAGQAGASTSVTIGGRVRTICQVSVSSAVPVSDAEAHRYSGRMSELCNNVEGYQLILRHPQGLENASVELDGQRIALSSQSTQTVIVDSQHPAARDRNFVLSFDAAAAVGDFNIEAQPKGPRF